VEELVISRPLPGDKPGLFEISSSTRDKHSNKPLHRETGYVRAVDKHRVEFMMAHPFGLTEVSEGNVLIDGEDTVKLEVTAKHEGFARSGNAKPPFVTELRRFYELHSGQPEFIDFIFEMATTTSPMQTHLVARYHRV
jgi:hypothetical protein